MNDFPKNPTQRIAVKLKSAAERKIRQGHPWIFNESITKESHTPNSGDLAIIYDHKSNKLLALGLFDCESPIRIKVIHFGGGAQINQEWFEHKFSEALAIRKPLLETDTNSYRLIFGEADGLPGVICDVYDGNAVLKLYSGAWLPYLEMLCNAIVNTIQANSIVIRLSRSLQRENSLGLKDGEVIFGHLSSEEVLFKEHGVLFSANLIHGHKTGFFLDHRANRKRVGEMSEGKTVLDVFSYAGGFSMHALCGGAERVLSTDISGPALELAQRNAALNEFNGHHEILKGDAFKELEKMNRTQEKFDIVIIDPPSFAKQKSEVEVALDQYARLARLGAQLVSNEGVLILASCSSRVGPEDFFDEVERAIEDSGKSFRLLNTYGHDVDHPTLEGFPEGRYLKCVYYQRLT